MGSASHFISGFLILIDNINIRYDGQICYMDMVLANYQKDDRAGQKNMCEPAWILYAYCYSGMW